MTTRWPVAGLPHETILRSPAPAPCDSTTRLSAIGSVARCLYLGRAWGSMPVTSNVASASPYVGYSASGLNPYGSKRVGSDRAWPVAQARRR